MTATLLVFSGSDGLTALQSTIILVGLPFFVMGWFQMYALLRALKEDAGELPPIRTREWAQVLPPEEYERREEDEEYDTDDYVVEPTFTTEVPVLTDPYEEIADVDLDYQPEQGTLPSRTGSSKADLPEGGRNQSH